MPQPALLNSIHDQLELLLPLGQEADADLVQLTRDLFQHRGSDADLLNSIIFAIHVLRDQCDAA
ncbi:MAG: hypothetical protein KME20_17065 [Kaiparowitsia implicata GSE-PSE-MK54-09C]|jgi:hypothetical protein|nr:hypothetical protein [Kaiparowitsia implicata GSE-PSE-MK54-09C]